MKKIILPLLLITCTFMLHAQENRQLRTVQAHTGVGGSNSLTLDASAGYLFDKHHGLRVGFFTQQRKVTYLLGSSTKISDAFRAYSAMYQFRVNAAENFDISLAAGPVLMAPIYTEYYKAEPGASYHISLNLWTNKQRPQWAGLGLWAGCGYMHGKTLDRFYVNLGTAVRFAY